jgi:hypothetical protein
MISNNSINRCDNDNTYTIVQTVFYRKFENSEILENVETGFQKSVLPGKSEIEMSQGTPGNPQKVRGFRVSSCRQCAR